MFLLTICFLLENRGKIMGFSCKNNLAKSPPRIQIQYIDEKEGGGGLIKNHVTVIKNVEKRE